MLDAMPSSNLKPEGEEEVELEANRVYRTTYMFSATMPPTVERLARKYLRRWGAVVVAGACLPLWWWRGHACRWRWLLQPAAHLLWELCLRTCSA